MGRSTIDEMRDNGGSGGGGGMVVGDSATLSWPGSTGTQASVGEREEGGRLNPRRRSNFFCLHIELLI